MRARFTSREADIANPETPAELLDEEWAHYVFFRDTTKGLWAERWSHAAGRRPWSNALCDTVTYRFAWPAQTVGRKIIAAGGWRLLEDRLTAALSRPGSHDGG